MPLEIICDTDMNIYKTLEIGVWGEPGSKPVITDPTVIERLQAKGAAAAAAGFSHGQYEGLEEQLPAMFITDDQGVVTYAHYGKDIMDMPVADDVLAML